MLRDLLLRRPVVLRLVAGSATAAMILPRCAPAFARESSPSANTALNTLWTTALDGMIEVPGCEQLSSAEGVLYLAPAPAAPESRSKLFSKSDAPVAWPKIFAKSVVFSLTASNPQGSTAPAAWNREANAALEQEIGKLAAGRTAPRAWWRSFGFNIPEGWREDGFSLAFAPEERLFARNAVLKLAHRFRQAAIYEYSVVDGELVREVVWVTRAKQEEHGGSKEQMRLVRAPPQTKLAARSPPDDDGGGDEAAAAAAAPPPAHSPTGRVKPSVWSLRW